MTVVVVLVVIVVVIVVGGGVVMMKSVRGSRGGGVDVTMNMGDIVLVVKIGIAGGNDGVVGGSGRGQQEQGHFVVDPGACVVFVVVEVVIGGSVVVAEGAGVVVDGEGVVVGDSVVVGGSVVDVVGSSNLVISYKLIARSFPEGFAGEL